MRPKIIAISILLFACSAFAETPNQLAVQMNSVTANEIGASIGTITLINSDKGLVFAPKLNGLQPGEHGFHIHENPDCGPGEKDGKPAAAIKAGGHFDPERTGKHLGPEGAGHKGDLPPLIVDTDGTASKTFVAPRLKLENVMGRSLMIHAGGDNFSDAPAPLGGGGARIACGVIK